MRVSEEVEPGFFKPTSEGKIIFYTEKEGWIFYAKSLEDLKIKINLNCLKGNQDEHP